VKSGPAGGSGARGGARLGEIVATRKEETQELLPGGREMACMAESSTGIVDSERPAHSTSNVLFSPHILKT
jgi:hypothetical protein